MTIDREILIYQSLPYKKYRWISYISVMQIGFLLVNLIFLPTHRLISERQEALANKVRRKSEEEIEKASSSGEFVEEFEPNPDYDPSTVWERFKKLKASDIFSYKNIHDNLSDRPLLSVGILTAAGATAFSFSVYARRMIHKITLLPNEQVKLAFFSPIAIGEPSTVVLPLRDVSCVQGRRSPNNYSILKLRNYLGYHLVHKAEGQFLDPKLYDQHLGYSRSWAKPVSR